MMSKQKKTIIGVTAGIPLFVAFVVAGQYAGAYLFASLQKIPSAAVSITTLWDYWHAYSDIRLVKLALIGGFAVSALVPILPLVIVAFVVFSGDKRELHGSARFATDQEIKKAGLSNDDTGEWPGVIVAKRAGKFLFFVGQKFISLAAPTRSGKGVGVVIPNLLSYRHSVVVLDIKLENWLLTSGFRSRNGQQCYLFCPGNPELKTHRWNPLSYIRRDQTFRVGDVQNIANSLYPIGGKDTFWNDNAQVLFLGLALYMIDTPDETVSLTNLMRLTSPSNGESLHKWIEATISSRENAKSELPKLSLECIQALRSYSVNTDNVRANILSTLLAPLKIFRNPLVAAATSGDDFDLRDVRKKKMSIYIGLNPDDLVNFSLLVNLFFSQLISENTRVLPENDKTLRYQCLLMMDEFTALGRIQIIQKAVAYMAGYNMRLLLIFQNKAQIVGRENGYGPEGASTLLTNCGMKIMFQPKENEDAKEYSETLGYLTFKSRSKTRQLSGKTGASENETPLPRALMLPQEVKEIGFNKMLISMENCRPIIADKIIYWSDPAFEGRIGLKPPEVPLLDISRSDTVTRALLVSEYATIKIDDIANQKEILSAIGDAIGFDFSAFTTTAAELTVAA